MLKSVKIDSVSKIIEERLKEAIENGTIRAGEKLTEQLICDEMQVSRTPVREAFRMLQVEGYLTYKPRYGVVVTELSIQDIDDLWEVRMSLEDLVARKTAKFVDDKAKSEIKRELEKIKRILHQSEIEEDEFTKIDEKYYQIHISNCNNKRLKEEVELLRINSSLIRNRPKYSQKRARASLQEIADIYDSYLDNDEEAASKCNRIHFLSSLEEIKKFM